MSNNISTKLNLAALKHSRMNMKGVSGMVDCLIIPIEANMLYKGEKGLYLDLTHLEIKDRSKQSEGQKDTHLVKQSFLKDVYEKMTDEEKRAFPILGSTIVWAKNSNESQLANSIEETDDLPF